VETAIRKAFRHEAVGYGTNTGNVNLVTIRMKRAIYLLNGMHCRWTLLVSTVINDRTGSHKLKQIPLLKLSIRFKEL